MYIASFIVLSKLALKHEEVGNIEDAIRIAGNGRDIMNVAYNSVSKNIDDDGYYLFSEFTRIFDRYVKGLKREESKQTLDLSRSNLHTYSDAYTPNIMDALNKLLSKK